MQHSLYKISEIELQYKPKIKACERPILRCTEDIYEIFMQHWNMDMIGLIEEFKVILLNRSNAVLGILNVSKGGLTGVIADPRIIFAAAIKSGATGILICHNHPAMVLTPSEQDLTFTENLKNIGAMLDINVIDHLIINEEGYFSFACEELL
ncbi:JAB domain-containing protein [Pedobacter gandavensis]|uniref:JAB domain-containing protein n=1 Tax=Pedobacter gandavensis TaxID=2679963 RepID=UPI0029304BD7|nr:JAB domain-containing protein [Pedobacter gandavensis]